MRIEMDEDEPLLRPQNSNGNILAVCYGGLISLFSFLIRQFKKFTQPLGDKDTMLIRLFVLSGWLLTLLAMIPPGLLAGLTTDKPISDILARVGFFDKPVDIFIRLSVFLIVTYAATEGKRRLVSFFNQKEFEKLLDNTKSFFTPNDWSMFDVMVFLATIPQVLVISGIFAVLAQVSVSREYGAAGLLENYGYNWTNAIAAIITQPISEATLMLIALFVAMVGFPAKPALMLLIDATVYAVKTPTYKHYEENIKNYIEAARLKVIQFHKDKEYESLAGFKTQLTTENVFDHYKLISYVKSQRELIKLPSHQSWVEFLLRNILAFIFTSLAIYGVLNFYGIAIFLAEFVHWTASPGPEILGILAMAAISSLVISSVYPTTSAWVGKWWGRNPDMGILSNKVKIRNAIFTFIVCTIGALTNLQQAFISDKKYGRASQISNEVAAFVSPVLIELGAFYAYTASVKEKVVTLENHDLKLAHDVNVLLSSARDDVSNLSEDEINQIAYEIDNEALPASKFWGGFFSKSTRLNKAQTKVVNNYYLQTSVLVIP